VLRCPQCAGTLALIANELAQLDCLGCALTYPVRDAVPVLVIGEATARPTPTDPEFDRLVAEAIATPFSGWNWDQLANRLSVTPDARGDLHGLYEKRATALVRQSDAMLDLGTGGGEQLARYAPFPSLAIATEAYPSNVALAAQQLGPLGVQVIWNDPNCQHSKGPQPGNRWPQRRLPFGNASFDLVLARRTAFSPTEVARVLQVGGCLLTLQNRTDWQGETLADALGATPPEWTVPGNGWSVGHTLFEAGFVVDQWLERTASVRYLDIGAVVYTLLHNPWIVPDFEIARYRERLFELHQRIQREGGFTTQQTGLLVEARRP
jgi:uncharacterized protein YbaR (Trm112 family)